MKQPIKRKRAEMIHGRQDLRKIFHIAIGMFGFLYAFMEWEMILFAWILALICAWFFSSRVEAFEIFLNKDEIKRGYSPAMVGYAVVMIVGTLLFRDTMKDSGLILLSALAFGDGFAALVGISYRGTSLKYNPDKTVNGMLAFIFFGTIGALVMLLFHAAFTIHVPFQFEIGSLPIFRVLIVMVVCAIVETIPFKVSDNYIIGMFGIISLLLTMGIYH